MTAVLSEYKKRGAKAKASAEKIDIPEVAEVQQTVITAVADVVSFAKECTGLTKALGKAAELDDAQDILTQIEDKLGEVAENVAIAENGVVDANDIKARIEAEKQEAERLAASLKMKRAEATGLQNAIQAAATKSEETLAALDEIERQESWGEAWDDAHQCHAAIVDALDAALGVMEGVTRAEHEAEADEGISDLKRLEEQVDTDEEKVSAFVAEIQRRYDEAKAQAAAREKAIAAVREAAASVRQKWMDVAQLWTAQISEAPDAFDGSELQDPFVTVTNTYTNALEIIDTASDLERVQGAFDALQEAQKQAQTLCDDAMARISAFRQEQEAAEEEARRMKSLRDTAAELAASLTASMESAQALMERLDAPRVEEDVPVPKRASQLRDAP